ncbi:MAG: type II secretion system protein N [Gammaproteobacteria bacterium]|nr:MAG: type II secretion system protein N [Gammaproteobacteria bacterium]
MISSSVAIPKLNANKNFWISLGVIVWLYVVISNFPAIWAAYAFTRGGDVAMSGVTGTIWNGRASLASMKIKDADRAIGQLTWKLSPLSLFTFKLCAQVTTQMDNQDFDGYVCYKGKNSLSLKKASGNFPAALVQPMIPLAIDGQFSFNLDNLNVEKGQIKAVHGKTSWLNAKIYNGANWMPLGNVAADLIEDGKNGLSAHVADVGGPVHLDLVTIFAHPVGGSVRGSVSMPEPYFRELNAEAWLSLFATRQADDAQGNLVFAVDQSF